VGGIDIQIDLEDQRSIATLGRVLRATLRRAVATWAPMVLPVHRIVVGAGFPAEGKADIYDSFTPGYSDQVDRRLVVISLGLRNGDRDLEPFDWPAHLPRRSNGSSMTSIGSTPESSWMRPHCCRQPAD